MHKWPSTSPWVQFCSADQKSSHRGDSEPVVYGCVADVGDRLQMLNDISVTRDFLKIINTKTKLPFIKWNCCNKGQAFRKALLFWTAWENLLTLHTSFLLVLCCINLDNVWHLFYQLPARGKTGWKLAAFCQKKKRGIADGNPCCVALFHCRHPSVYLAAKLVMLMENKQPLQRPLKMNERNEQITQPFYACRLQDRHSRCNVPLRTSIISNPVWPQYTNVHGAANEPSN